MKINTTRTDNMIFNLEGRLNQIKFFVNEKIEKLQQKQNSFDLFLKEVGGAELEIGNMYSTGTELEEYTSQSQMIAHATFRIGKTYKNLNLLEKKIQTAWEKAFPITEVSMAYLKFENCPVIVDNTVLQGIRVKLQMWIK